MNGSTRSGQGRLARRAALRGLGGALAAALLLGSCASFSGQRFDGSTNPKPPGVYVFDEVPLLVIANAQATIVMVRSPDRGTAIQFSAFLAKHDVTLEFTPAGGLSKVTSNQDTTALPLAITGIVKDVVDKLPAGLGLSDRAGPAASSIQVFRIVFQNGEIVGLKPLLGNEAFVSMPPPPPTAGTPVAGINSQAPKAGPCDPATLQPGTTCPPEGPVK